MEFLDLFMVIEVYKVEVFIPYSQKIPYLGAYSPDIQLKLAVKPSVQAYYLAKW